MHRLLAQGIDLVHKGTTSCDDLCEVFDVLYSELCEKVIVTQELT